MTRPPSRIRGRSLLATAIGMVAGLLVAAPTPAGAVAVEDATAMTADLASAAWASSWATAQQPPKAPFPGESNWSTTGFDDHTVRQVVRLSAGGAQLRIRLSNRFGTRPLHVAGATVARTSDGAAVAAESQRRLRFAGAPSTTIGVGEDRLSDPVSFGSDAREQVTVTLYLDRPTGPATFHDAAYSHTYRAAGDHLLDPASASFDETTTSWYFLTGVLVRGATRPHGTVVAFGDSLTDGRGMRTGVDNRYPDELAELYAARGMPRAVANLGLNGNKLLVDSGCFGQRGVDRFGDQVLAQPGATVAIVSLGLNDIGSAGWPEWLCGANPVVTARQVIDGHREIVRLARARGLMVVGATLTPMKGHGYHSPVNERVRDEVNQWLRTSGEYDAVVDFEAVLADPGDPDALAAAYDSGDHLHPNDAGRRQMARAVLAVLDREQAARP